MIEIFCTILTFLFMLFLVNEACDFFFDINPIAYLKTWIDALIIAKKGNKDK